METKPNYTAVGAFVILLTGFIVLAIIWLSAGLSVISYITYKVYMKEAVSGLNPDAPVEYNGVNVGKVKTIEINKKNPQLVELLLDVKSDAPITEGTRAKLDIRSLTGNAYISLIDKGLDMTPLTKLPGQPYPIINTIPSILVRLDTTLTQLSASFRQISESFHGVSNSINALLNEQNLHSIKEILNNFKILTVEVLPLIRSGKNSMQLVETQTLPSVNQMFLTIDKITTDLNSLTNDLKGNPTMLIRGRAPTRLGPGEK